MRPLIRLLTCVLLAAACDSRPALVFPSAVSQPSEPSAVSPVRPMGQGPLLISPQTIALGEDIRGAVQSADPTCFPNWDASGRCQQFEVTMTGPGTLTVRLHGTGLSRGMYNTEMFVVSPNEGWMCAGNSWPDQSISVTAQNREKFRLVVLSYGPFPDEFQIRADLMP